MGKKIICPKPGCENIVLAEWMEGKDLFKIIYTEEQKKKMKKHKLVLPIQTTCAFCKQLISISSVLNEDYRCTCCIGTSDFLAIPLLKIDPPGRRVLVNLASVLRSIDCFDAKVRCLKCSNELYLRRFFSTGEVLGTTWEQDQKIERQIELNQGPD